MPHEDPEYKKWCKAVWVLTLTPRESLLYAAASFVERTLPAPGAEPQTSSTVMAVPTALVGAAPEICSTAGRATRVYMRLSASANAGRTAASGAAAATFDMRPRRDIGISKAETDARRQSMSWIKRNMAIGDLCDGGECTSGTQVRRAPPQNTAPPPPIWGRGPMEKSLPDRKLRHCKSATL